MDMLLQNVPRKEPKRQTSLTGLQEIKINGIDHLFWRNIDIYVVQLVWQKDNDK